MSHKKKEKHHKEKHHEHMHDGKMAEKAKVASKKEHHKK